MFNILSLIELVEEFQKQEIAGVWLLQLRAGL